MKDTQAKLLGAAVIELMNLQPDADNRVVTSWGTKTPIGLGYCIARLYKESQIAAALQDIQKNYPKQLEKAKLDACLADVSKMLGVDKASVLRVYRTIKDGEQ